MKLGFVNAILPDWSLEEVVRFAAEGQGVRIGIENCPMLLTADNWPGGRNLAINPAIWKRLEAGVQ